MKIVRSVIVFSFEICRQGPLEPTWQWDTANALAPSVVSIFVLVDVVTEVKNVVYRVFARGVSVGVEEAKR